MILVTGATGTVGREVVRELIERNQRVRAMTRDPSKLKPGTVPQGVEVVTGDLDQPQTLGPVLHGVTKIFALSSGPSIGKHDAALAQAAKAAGIRRLVKLSAETVADQPQQIIAKWHLAGEQAIKDAGLEWTFVRPGGFMSNALNWAHTIKAMGKVFAPMGDAKLAPIDPRDIAAVCAETLTRDGHAGKAYMLTGPEALTMSEQVACLGRAIDKPLTYVPVSDDVARENMTKAGMPPILVDAILELARNIRAGERAHVSPTVKEVTGRSGRRFADWAQEHRSAFM
jgi:uncharacterized protein YbjT (DUF2867 family)